MNGLGAFVFPERVQHRGPSVQPAHVDGESVHSVGDLAGEVVEHRGIDHPGAGQALGHPGPIVWHDPADALGRGSRFGEAPVEVDVHARPDSSDRARLQQSGRRE
ncbi:MAG: hypothetical protein ACJ8ER_05585 [Allosphingosinicella sp.]